MDTKRVIHHKLPVLDSHTGGEPTRVVLHHTLPLGDGSMRERLLVLQSEYDHFRSAIVNEPRGNDALVGALLCEPADPSCAAGVIFFNNVGYLGMCGHGTIGLIVTLAHLGRISAGLHRIETPVGVVQAELHASGAVTVHNVPSYRSRANVTVDVEGFGTVTGDIAWGGNWFFLTNHCPLELSLAKLEALTEYAWKIRQALLRNGLTGNDGAEIDHIELCGPPSVPHNDSKNFVLCPGKSYDRSPCGTGTSAKLACLYAEGKLAEGQVWRQESLLGSVFEGSITVQDGLVRPQIKGSAFVNAEAYLLFDQRDPLQWGVRPLSPTPALEPVGP
jgi:4-hydroxyproline epimerase